MKVIGLTGGIGTGKSTVTAYLKEKGFHVIDADEISRRITEKGSPVLDRVRTAFGDSFFTADGSLDRKKMAELVFNSSEDKKKLEDIITLQVLIEVGERIRLLREDGREEIVFLDAPLLYESGADRLTELVWLVTADDGVRIHRVMKRDNCSQEQVQKRIDSQMSFKEKAGRADEIIDNSGGREELYNQIEELIGKYADR